VWRTLLRSKAQKVRPFQYFSIEKFKTFGHFKDFNSDPQKGPPFQYFSVEFFHPNAFPPNLGWKISRLAIAKWA
jgi:hypothetical protein